MAIDREGILNALLAAASGPPCVVNFTADTQTGSLLLGNVAGAGGNLLAGLPIVGANIAIDTVLALTTPATLSIPATGTGSGVALRQGFQTIGVNADGSRGRLEHWLDVAEQPALYIDDGDEIWPAAAAGVPQKPDLEAELWIYARTIDPDLNPATLVNALLKALEAALAPQAVWAGRSIQNVQTLGRSDVGHVRIEGRMRKYSGHMEGQGIAVVPIRILVPQ